MVKKKYFGTDGIRGKVGSSFINPEFVLKLGWAVGCVLGQGLNKKILIGKDTRISGYMLESALEAGLSAAGVDVRLLGPMPTPAVAYLTQTLRASAGIVISASHNPYYDNGIKFFTAEGQKLDDEVELEIEKYLQKDLQIVDSALLGKAKRIDDAPGRYIEFCKSTIPSLTRLTSLKIVVDCANGATYHVAPNVFAELGANVITMANEPDGLNINKNSGSIYPEVLKAKVLENKADIGIALDGDGDRVVLVDAKGNILNGDKILYIIAKDRQQRGVLHGGIVGTLMSNFGLEQALQRIGIDFSRTFVGDRYILEALKEQDWRIGGEPSGHIVCLDKTSTGDGIVSALQVLAIMVKQEKTLEELCADIALVPQILVNLKTQKADLVLKDIQVKNLLDDIQKDLNNTGRVLLRSSGTEPLLRIMVECVDSAKTKTYAEHLQEKIQKIVEGYE